MKKFVILCVSFLFAASAGAVTLEEMTKEVVDSNPLAQEQFKTYNSVYQEYEKSKGGYLPRLDLYGGVGYEWVNNSNTDYTDRDGDVYQARAVLKQDLFTGFGLQNEIKKQKARLSSAKYLYFTEVNKLSYETAQQYITTLKTQAMYDYSNEIIKKQNAYLEMIEDRVESGVDLASDLERANAKIAGLYTDNLMKENSYRESLIKLEKLFGRFVDGRELARPSFDYSMIPPSLEEGMMTLKDSNPMLVSTYYDIDTQKYNYKESKKEYYPYIYAEVSHDLNNNMSGVDGYERETKAMLMLQYNIFNGTKDSKEVQKNVSLYQKSVDSKNRVARDLANDYQLTWSAHRLLSKQVTYLQRNKNSLSKVLKSYKSEYKLGKRRLVDIMDLESEIYSIDTKIVAANYDVMLFKFKLLYSLGILPKAINVDLPVKYGTEELPRYKDKLPVSFDKDADNVTDAGDFCQNSKGGEVSTGCNSPQTEAFLADPFVEPKPKVESYIVNTPDDLKANRLKTDVNVKTGIQFFEKGSNDLSVEALEIMRELVTQLREVSSTNSVSIFVYSNDEGDSDKDYILSSKRAYNLYRILLKNSVSRSGIITYGKKYTRTGSDTPLNYIEISVKDSAESIDTVYEIFSSSDLSFNGAGLEKSAEAGQLDDAAYESIAQFAVLSKTISSSVSLDVINFSYDKESAVDNKNAGDARAEIIADEFRKTGVGSLKITSFGMDYELSEDDIVSGSDSRKNRTYLIIHR